MLKFIEIQWVKVFSYLTPGVAAEKTKILNFLDFVWVIRTYGSAADRVMYNPG